MHAKRIALTLAALAVISPAPASAVTLEGPASDAMLPRLREWAANSAVPTANATVIVTGTNCRQHEAEACTALSPLRTYFPDVNYLWTEPGHPTRELEAERLNFLHEMGHAYDFSQTAHRYRLAFLRIMHFRHAHDRRAIVTQLQPDEWIVAMDEHGESAEPDEQFAMAYSYCAAGFTFTQMTRIFHGTYWGYGYNPTGRQYDAACALLRSLR